MIVGQVLPPMFFDKRAKRMADALYACIAASDAKPWGFLSHPRQRCPIVTAMNTLNSLRLVERYSNGWRVTNIGRVVAASWFPGTVA